MGSCCHNDRSIGNDRYCCDICAADKACTPDGRLPVSTQNRPSARPTGRLKNPVVCLLELNVRFDTAHSRVLKTSQKHEITEGFLECEITHYRQCLQRFHCLSVLAARRRNPVVFSAAKSRVENANPVKMAATAAPTVEVMSAVDVPADARTEAVTATCVEMTATAIAVAAAADGCAVYVTSRTNGPDRTSITTIPAWFRNAMSEQGCR